MPTELGQATFEALMEARRRFNEISSQLSDRVNDDHSAAGRELQQRWNDAFIEFEAATNRFYAIVQKYREEIVTRNRKSA